jgi:hypothetical protein
MPTSEYSQLFPRIARPAIAAASMQTRSAFEKLGARQKSSTQALADPLAPRPDGPKTRLRDALGDGDN